MIATKLAALSITGLVAMALFVSRADAQEAPKVGDVAPDFSLQGATKAGVTAKQLRLSDFRGQVVVLAFFPKARTKG